MFDGGGAPMDLYELISRLALALGIGLVIGLERGWRARDEQAGSRTAGIRTFTISGMLGGVVGALGQTLGGVGGGIVIGFGLAAYGAVMAVFCLEENRADKQYSATTLVAAILTFALGAYALVGNAQAAAAVAVATTVILALREPIHGWVKRITWPELRSGLVLLAMSFVALPILPDDPIGPYGGVNPREVWLIAIVLAAVSFAGYAGVKYFGESRGVLLAGVAGGLASSTAVTLANARRAAEGEGTPLLLAAGVALASVAMFVRVCAIVFAINAELLRLVAPPLLAAAAVAGGFAMVAVSWRRAGQQGDTGVALRNPFAFWPVVGFALFLGCVMMISRAIGEWSGAAGAIAGAAAVGLADVDAVTVSMARLAPGTLTARDAALAILAAAAANTIVKAVIGAAVGRGAFAVEISAMTLGCLVAGAATAFAVLSWSSG
jgi:uncharacterized membrane protein (DUF4010 family)